MDAYLASEVSEDAESLSADNQIAAGGTDALILIFLQLLSVGKDSTFSIEIQPQQAM